MAIIVQKVQERHVLVNGSRQYDFLPQEGGGVVVVCSAPRMTFRQEVSAQEAREQWQRLKTQGYVEW